MIRTILVTIAQRLLALAIDHGLRRGLPAIYRRLDAELPLWINQPVQPSTVDSVISQTAAQVLRRDPKPYELALVKLRYDPARAIANAHLSRTNR